MYDNVILDNLVTLPIESHVKASVPNRFPRFQPLQLLFKSSFELKVGC